MRFRSYILNDYRPVGIQAYRRPTGINGIGKLVRGLTVRPHQ